MATGEQGSTPRLVLLETWPRETISNFFCSIYRTSTVNIPLSMVITWVYFFYIQLSELIFTAQGVEES